MRSFVVLVFLFPLFIFAQTGQELELARAYFAEGEYEKAASIYAVLAKNDPFQPVIYRPYLTALMRAEKTEETEKFLKKSLRKRPTHPEMNVELGLLYQRTERKGEAKKHFEKYVDKIKDNDGLLRNAARYFSENGLYDYAETLYLSGRDNGRSNFSYELGNLYAVAGKSEKMIREYLNILRENAAQQNYIQRMLQSRITDEKDWALLEKLLYENVQDNPDRLVYNEMLIWYYLQKKEFYRAFLQARAVDKRKQQGGRVVLSVGTQSLNNEDYKAAVKIFTYLTDNYKDNPRVYFTARNGLMTAKEALVKQTYPIDLAAIRSLVQDYEETIQESGLNDYTAELARNQALLHAFYLDSKDTAIRILEKLVTTPQLKQRYVSQAKIDLGDIFLLRGEWWESTLLYSQVEKAERERDLGHEAKLRNAKLSYYRGDFPLAKSHLDVLKLATSRKIANNAMELSLLIQENTGLDTSEVAMQRFAAIDLLVFQQQYPQAMEAYDKMLQDFPDHSLEDEIYWRKAQLYQKLGRPKDAQKELERIISIHNEDIFGDDANFTLAKLYEEEFDDPEKAMELYLKQLTDYQDSIYNAEARKRLRRLRGDDPQ